MEVGRQHAHVVDRFGEHAAQSDHQHRTPIRIAARAQDQLQPRTRHRLDQHAVERERGATLGKVGVELRPTLRQRLLVSEVKHHPAGIALVRERRRLRLQRDRIADRRGRALRGRKVGHQSAIRNRNFRRLEQRFGGMLGDHARRQARGGARYLAGGAARRARGELGHAGKRPQRALRRAEIGHAEGAEV